MGSLADVIHNARINLGVSIRTFASMVDCSAMYISEIESGKKIPLQGDALPKIAQVLGMDPVILINLAYKDKQNQRINSLPESLAVARTKPNQTKVEENLKKIINVKEPL